MLIDRATIFVRSGKGGSGCVSLRREKYIPRGGPDGGDGGCGGDVVLVGDPGLDTLLGLTYSPHFFAANGRPGKGKSMHGADGEDSIVRVPPGTLVYDKDTGEYLADITSAEDRYVVVRGGRGGFGNEHFKTSTDQTPREATPGEPVEERTLRLELKLIADVGLVGKPNAGKSTLLSAVSRATPKVAEYPFTTRSPCLGIAELAGGRMERRLVIADIPGLIEGASAGAGLGHEFLRHIERTTVLVHLVDIAPVDGSDPAENYTAIRRELAEYSPALAEKTEIVALNKIDLVPASDRAGVIERIGRACRDSDRAAPMVISGATGEGLRELLEACWQSLGKSEPVPWKAGGAAAGAGRGGGGEKIDRE
ncbi:MAG: GTPase ObgE [Planctomycetes bacterium]|nr:GTPase ObgE [Planctomycetota bacterium]